MEEQISNLKLYTYIWSKQKFGQIIKIHLLPLDLSCSELEYTSILHPLQFRMFGEILLSIKNWTNFPICANHL